MVEKKKKILYLVTQAEWGGAQKYVFNLASNLKDVFDVTVGIGPDGHSQELVKQLQNQNIKTVIFNHLKRKIGLFQDYLAVKEIGHFIKNNNFDVLHLNSTKAGVVGSLAGWFKKTPKIIYTAHGWVFEESLSPLKRQLFLFLERLSGKLRHHTIVLSEKEKVIALKNKIATSDKISVIPNGLDLSNIFFLDKKIAWEKINALTQNNLQPTDTLIGTIANLYPTKKLDTLIEALAKIKDLSNLKVVIIGDGPEKKYLQTKILDLQLEKNIFLIGTLVNAQQYLKVFDLFTLCSTKEGFPFAILEAMAAQLPIITTAVGAIPEILKNQESALFVELNNPTDLATAIKILIQNSVQAKNLAEKAHQAVTKYDLPEIIKRTSSLY
ncbi:MAG TPA: glycosyltransferase [Candidatus Magasanikbacteria bacterium]|nr:glycosyltransferase [Candidatus Magasanikbacteria bacterium]